MAQITLAITKILRTGDDPTAGGVSPSHATEGFLFPNDGLTFIYVENTGGSAVVITMISQKTVVGLAVADPTISIAMTTGVQIFGPFPRDVFNIQSGANIGKMSCTTVANGTDLTLHAYRFSA